MRCSNVRLLLPPDKEPRVSGIFSVWVRSGVGDGCPTNWLIRQIGQIPTQKHAGVFLLPVLPTGHSGA